MISLLLYNANRYAQKNYLRGKQYNSILFMSGINLLFIKVKQTDFIIDVLFMKTMYSQTKYI